MTLRLNFLLGAAALIGANAMPALAADTYTFDPMHTTINWSINHFGFSNPSGKFVMVDGTVTLDQDHPENSKVSAKIAISNLVTGLPKLDEHLKTKDFFDIAEFPEATFTSTGVNMTGKDTAAVAGNLTLRGVTKPVTLEVKLNKTGINMMKKQTVGFSMSTHLKRSDFGMVAYLPGLGDDVAIEIESEANLAAPQ